MKILCNHCKHFFEVNPEKEGRIQYSKTKSIFRVELILKSPCPKCHTPLKVVSQKQQHIGYAIEPTTSDPSTRPAQVKNASVSASSETVFNPTSLKNHRSKPPSSRPELEQEDVETKMALSANIEAKKEITIKRSLTTEERVKANLEKRMNSHHRYSVQSYKISQTKNKNNKNKVVIPNLEKIASHALQPKFYLTAITLVTALLMFGMMQSIFQNEEVKNIAKQEAPKMEDNLEEFEPIHHEDPIGGPSLPSESNRKIDLDDETIKRITSNLQILHLPPLNQVTSTYGIRLDPFTKKLAFHAGVDFRAHAGTKIEAAMDGIVKYAGRKNMYGNAVIIKHNNGYETLYGHMSKVLVKQGDRIKQKDVIGLAGSTGRSTGPHLHFELIKNGKKIDALSTDLLATTKK